MMLSFMNFSEFNVCMMVAFQKVFTNFRKQLREFPESVELIPRISSSWKQKNVNLAHKILSIVFAFLYFCTTKTDRCSTGFFWKKFQKLKPKITQEIQNSRAIFPKNSMFLPQNSMFRNFYLVKICQIFLKTQKFSQKLTILTSKLKLSELSST